MNKKVELSKVKKILVIKFKHIGDVLLMVPTIRALRERFPKAHIACLINKGTEEMLTGVQAELDAIKANPPVLEVDFIDIGEITRLTNLKLTREASEGSTYVVECQLELIDELPGLVNVVDVELYIDYRFIDSDRWIDVSSTGFVITKSNIRIDTGLDDFVESITLKIIPAFKVYGT